MPTKINDALSKKELERMYHDLSRFQLTYGSNPSVHEAAKIVKGALLDPIFALRQAESIPKTKEK